MDQKPVSRKGARPSRRRPRASVELPQPLETVRPADSLWPRYGFAVGMAVLAFAVEALATRFFRPVRFFLFYPGAFLTTWLVGAGPAIVYIVLALVGADVLFIMYEGGSLVPDAVRGFQMGLFAVFNLLAAWLIWRGRRAEAALRASERRLRIFGALIENSTDFIGIADPDGNPVYVNPAGRRLVGLGEDESIEQTRIPDYYPEDLRTFVSDVIVKSMLEGGRWSGETHFRHWRTEERIPVSDEHFAIREPETGRVLGMGTVTRDITERKRLEAEVRQLAERQRFRAALEAAAIATIVIDRRGRIAFVNDEAARLVGWSRSELVGMALEDLVPDRFRAVHGGYCESFFQQAVAKRPMGAAAELFILRRDGVEVPVEIGLARVEEGGEALVVASVADISLRKRAEEERSRLLRETLADLEAMTKLQRLGAMSLEGSDLAPILIEIVDAAISISGADFGSIQILDAASGDLRIAAARGFPKWWLDFWDRVSKGKGACGTALERKERVIVEDVESDPIFAGTAALEVQRKAGVRAVQSTPLLSRSGEPVGMFSTHYWTPGRSSARALRLLDILARQAADIIEQARVRENLRESEQRLRLLIQGTRDYGIFMIDREGLVTVWNEGAARMLGYCAEEAIGRSFYRFVPPETVPRARAQLSMALENGSYEIETWRVRKDGARLWTDVVTSPIFGPDGRHLGFSKVLRDLTERKKAESDIQESQDRLRRSVLELEAFAYTISHDLRAPLRAIEGYSHFLSQRLAAVVDAESREMLGRIGKAAARLDRLIRDLLSYAAIGREAVALEPVDLDEVVSHVSGLYPEIAKAKFRVRSPLGRVRAQPSFMIQILANVLINAVKFRAPEREPEIVVWTERSAPGCLKIVVQDNGIGIPKESRERIFRPFERGHALEKYEGTGIGLAIVKRAAECMGGRIWLESEPGKGSRFSIELQEA